MEKNTNDNSLLSYWERVAALPPELQEIVHDNWDETGRPTSMRSESNVIIALLNKNAAEGFPGFKNDMDLIFAEKKISEYELAKYYNIYMGGAQYIAERIAPTTSNKPKMK